MTEPKEIAERACARIAPVWPLDRFIAVNPFWGHIDKPFPRVAGELAALSGARLIMPRAWFAEEWREGRLRQQHLSAAIGELGSHLTEEQLTALFWIEDKPPPRRPLVVDVMDTRCHRALELSWRDFIVARLGLFCASYFDDGQAQIHPDRKGGLYKTWRAQARRDRGISLFMGLDEYRTAVAALPKTADEMLATAWAELEVPAEQREAYLTALLLDINGWSSWCAYLRWTARLADRDDHHIVELLAIRVAWEWILLRAGGQELRADWRHALASWPVIDNAAQMSRTEDWLLQRAAEIAWTSRITENLPRGFAAARSANPDLQAVFCLDVRSEPYRRALEAESKDIETLACAGFFGLPVEYSPLAADGARPQLPGLLAPKYRVTDVGAPAGLEEKRKSRLYAAQAWKAFRSNSLSSFAFVDAIGLLFGADILRESFGRGARPSAYHESVGLDPKEHVARAPRITSRVDGAPISLPERCELAEGMLRAMSLTRGFARTVLLVGHGAGTRNNPHAAGLDCGACCGQTGEVNARAAAALLNDAEVRAGLAGRGIEIPATTRFVAGLHNTTTDDVVLFEEAASMGELRGVLERASVAARRERAPKLGLGGRSDAEVHAAVLERAKNWAEVRPEWGLAGNATLIVAPRERTRHLDLSGRAFLHDYRFDEDQDGAILELIMTAPLVVSHWINFQYYASMVDNRRYGSGNKVLHNVVGGHLGVYEGNGGDLRIGLSIQSLHDGERWMHAPLRLSVFIEAPRPAIDRVLEKHATVRNLVDNEWVHLFQIDTTERGVHARRNGEWVAIVA
ncbi:MAG: DUF2309 domain-containing protein [Labilithrix sp.]|nr:DUF2309 domain-containing protein [Labilithrix sp.]MCW5813077.1 DUF2309 domain-containing protein [Labilithrix sp.]